ncbi:MAG: hypothetical protein LQ340_006034 [Diploschistes diacapsis]|nr:MAG: hypothetical protein LQ340_006034 [Diploschistes diacapsis]
MDESPGKMYALASVMTMLAVVPVLLRFRVRSNQNLSLGPDDWLMIPALIGTLGSAIAMYIATAEGGLGLHTPIGPDGAPDFTDATVIFLKASFVTLLTQIVTFSCTKLSVIFFYRRIFVGIVFNIASWTLITIVLLWSVGYFFANLFECKPIEANWVANGVSSTCVDELTMYISESWTDVFTDVLILSLPLPMIWKLHMTTARKLALCGVFLLGAL